MKWVIANSVNTPGLRRTIHSMRHGCARRVTRVALTSRGTTLAAELVTLAERYEAEVLARHPRAEDIKIEFGVGCRRNSFDVLQWMKLLTGAVLADEYVVDRGVFG